MMQDSSPKIGRSLLVLIPMIVLSAFAAMQAVSATDMQMNIATAIAVIYVLTMFFLIIHTGFYYGFIRRTGTFYGLNC